MLTLGELRDCYFMDNPKCDVIVIDYDTDDILHYGRAEFMDLITNYGYDTKIVTFSSEWYCNDPMGTTNELILREHGHKIWDNRLIKGFIIFVTREK